MAPTADQIGSVLLRYTIQSVDEAKRGSKLALRFFYFLTLRTGIDRVLMFVLVQLRQMIEGDQDQVTVIRVAVVKLSAGDLRGLQHVFTFAASQVMAIPGQSTATGLRWLCRGQLRRWAALDIWEDA